MGVIRVHKRVKSEIVEVWEEYYEDPGDNDKVARLVYDIEGDQADLPLRRRCIDRQYDMRDRFVDVYNVEYVDEED